MPPPWRGMQPRPSSRASTARPCPSACRAALRGFRAWRGRRASRAYRASKAPRETPARHSRCPRPTRPSSPCRWAFPRTACRTAPSSSSTPGMWKTPTTRACGARGIRPTSSSPTSPAWRASKALRGSEAPRDLRDRRAIASPGPPRPSTAATGRPAWTWRWRARGSPSRCDSHSMTSQAPRATAGTTARTACPRPPGSSRPPRARRSP